MCTWLHNIGGMNILVILVLDPHIAYLKNPILLTLDATFSDTFKKKKYIDSFDRLK